MNTSFSSLLSKYNVKHSLDTENFNESLFSGELVDSSIDVNRGDILLLDINNPDRLIKYVEDGLANKPSYIFIANYPETSSITIQNYLYNLEKRTKAAPTRVIRIDDYSNFVQELVSLKYPTYKTKNLFGITGTNGKTTSCYFTKILLGEMNTEFIGTTEAGAMSKVTKMPSLTTPNFIPVAKYIQENKDKDNFIIEVSSHAMIQKRLNGIQFDIASFTNLSQDHLDFHKSLEEYFEAKKLLFSSEKSKFAIIFSNEWGLKLAEKLDIDFVTVGFRSSDFASFNVHQQDSFSTEGELLIDGKKYNLLLPISGPGAIENFLIAITNTYYLQNSFEDSLNNIKHLCFPEGRYQSISKNTKNIIIDYAHTPEALNKLLYFAKKHYQKVTVVFGCGGNRDSSKRELMGRSSQIADSIILTSDNPRDENPEIIIKAILKGIDQKEKVLIVVDRREAIEISLRECRKEEVVIIAGRGHESYQEIKGEYIPLKDINVVEEILRGAE